MINLEDIGHGDKIVVQDAERNVVVGPALVTHGLSSEIQVWAFGQRITVARANRNGTFKYVASGVRVVGHQPPLGVIA